MTFLTLLWICFTLLESVDVNLTAVAVCSRYTGRRNADEADEADDVGALMFTQTGVEVLLGSVLLVSWAGEFQVRRGSPFAWRL